MLNWYRIPVKQILKTLTISIISDKLIQVNKIKQRRSSRFSPYDNVDRVNNMIKARDREIIPIDYDIN